MQKLILSQNHLIETASSSTGSLLIWDTGEYEMLPYREPTQRETDDELSPTADEDIDSSLGLSDSQKLHQAFQNVMNPLPKSICPSTKTSPAQNPYPPPRHPSPQELHPLHPPPHLREPPHTTPQTIQKAAPESLSSIYLLSPRYTTYL